MATRMKPGALFAWALASLLFATACFAQDMLQLGQMSYSRAQAPLLRMPVTTSVRFFRGVGGVAFSAVAEGESGLKVVGLKYDAAAADGDRLLIALESSAGPVSVRGRIYDWQLVPIARFALDENGSAMTLFGQLNDKALEEKLIRKRDRVINYHPAFDNTLVGLRLLQADILIIQPNAVHLFKQGPNLLLGAGEAGHDPDKNMERFQRISDWQVQQLAKGNKYQSYVVGDLGQRVVFRHSQGRIAFTGSPYWNCWRGKLSQQEVAERAKELQTTYENAVNGYNEAVAAARSNVSSMTQTQQAQTVAHLKILKSRVEEIEKSIESKMESLSAVEQMPEFSEALSQQIRRQQGVNPVVYATVQKVMHYRALFKHFQAADPAGYASFVASLRSVPVSPSVVTPTVQHTAL